VTVPNPEQLRDYLTAITGRSRSEEDWCRRSHADASRLPTLGIHWEWIDTPCGAVVSLSATVDGATSGCRWWRALGATTVGLSPLASGLSDRAGVHILCRIMIGETM
jgi:hypothetical protein